MPDGESPFPLLVFAHGLNGHPSRFTELATTWAEAGYVVAVPAFPLTNDEIEGNTDWRDYVNQPEDVSFVIDEVLRLSDERHPLLGGRVDADRIGVGGLSLGGATVSAWHSRTVAVTTGSTRPSSWRRCRRKRRAG